jgi:hypothetical protein
MVKQGIWQRDPANCERIDPPAISRGIERGVVDRVIESLVELSLPSAREREDRGDVGALPVAAGPDHLYPPRLAAACSQLIDQRREEGCLSGSLTGGSIDVPDRADPLPGDRRDQQSREQDRAALGDKSQCHQ